MTRDFDLIRQILLDVENLPAGQRLKEFNYPGFTWQTVYEHIGLMEKHDFIEVGRIKLMGSLDQIEIKGLTWKGHDFIRPAKDKSIWDKVKETALTTTGTVTLDLLLELLKAEAKRRGIL
jgi:hypothetical protein